MRRLILLLLIAAGAGCYGSEGYAVSASYASPSGNLVYVGNGVYAVAGYEDPVFYADNFYWRYANGYWYRSPYLGYGWSYYARPPRVIARIDRPYYTHRRFIEYRHRPVYRRPYYRRHPQRVYRQRYYPHRTRVIRGHRSVRGRPHTVVRERRVIRRDHRRRHRD